MICEVVYVVSFQDEVRNTYTAVHVIFNISRHAIAITSHSQLPGGYGANLIDAVELILIFAREPQDRVQLSICA